MDSLCIGCSCYWGLSSLDCNNDNINLLTLVTYPFWSSSIPAFSIVLSSIYLARLLANCMSVFLRSLRPLISLWLGLISNVRLLFICEAILNDLSYASIICMTYLIPLDIYPYIKAGDSFNLLLTWTLLTIGSSSFLSHNEKAGISSSTSLSWLYWSTFAVSFFWCFSSSLLTSS